MIPAFLVPWLLGMSPRRLMGAAHRHMNPWRAHALQGQCDNCGEDNGQGLTTSRSRGLTIRQLKWGAILQKLFTQAQQRASAITRSHSGLGWLLP